MGNKYQTIWVQEDEMPDEEETCPRCKTGILKVGKYGGIICYECRSAWKISKYPFKETPESGGFQKAVGGDEKVLEALRKIYAKIDNLERQFKDFIIIFGNKDKLHASHRGVIHPNVKREIAMNAGSPRIVLRLPAELIDTIDDCIASRNQQSRGQPMNRSEWIRAAINEKIAKTMRSRGESATTERTVINVRLEQEES